MVKRFDDMPFFILQLKLIGQFLPFAAPAVIAIVAFPRRPERRRLQDLDELSLGPGFFLFDDFCKHPVPGDAAVDKHRKPVGFCQSFAPKGKIDDVQFIGFIFFNGGHFPVFLGYGAHPGFQNLIL